jgi:hypothetical protein
MKLKNIELKKMSQKVIFFYHFLPFFTFFLSFKDNFLGHKSHMKKDVNKKKV